MATRVFVLDDLGGNYREAWEADGVTRYTDGKAVHPDHRVVKSEDEVPEGYTYSSRFAS